MIYKRSGMRWGRRGQDHRLHGCAALGGGAFGTLAVAGVGYGGPGICPFGFAAGRSRWSWSAWVRVRPWRAVGTKREGAFFSGDVAYAIHACVLYHQSPQAKLSVRD
jgi:hypothetical protein